MGGGCGPDFLARMQIGLVAADGWMTLRHPGGGGSITNFNVENQLSSVDRSGGGLLVEWSSMTS